MGRTPEPPQARVDQTDAPITPPSDKLYDTDDSYEYHWKSIRSDNPSNVMRALAPRHLGNGTVMAPYELVRYGSGVKVHRLFADGPAAEPGYEDLVRDRDLVLCRIKKTELAKLQQFEHDNQMVVENALTGGQKNEVFGPGGGKPLATVTAGLKDIEQGSL